MFSSLFNASSALLPVTKRSLPASSALAMIGTSSGSGIEGCVVNGLSASPAIVRRARNSLAYTVSSRSIANFLTSIRRNSTNTGLGKNAGTGVRQRFVLYRKLGSSWNGNQRNSYLYCLGPLAAEPDTHSHGKAETDLLDHQRRVQKDLREWMKSGRFPSQ